MTRDELRTAMLETLKDVAPDTEPETVAGDADLRDALDLDSMDLLNFVTALHERFGVEIPDREQRNFVTLDGGLAYLEGRLESASQSG